MNKALETINQAIEEAKEQESYIRATIENIEERAQYEKLSEKDEAYLAHFKKQKMRQENLIVMLLNKRASLTMAYKIGDRVCFYTEDWPQGNNGTITSRSYQKITDPNGEEHEEVAYEITDDWLNTYSGIVEADIDPTPIGWSNVNTNP